MISDQPDPRDAFLALVDAYRSRSGVYVNLAPLQTAIQITADRWPVAPLSILPIRPVSRLWKRYGSFVGAIRDSRTAVVLIDQLSKPERFRIRVDCFLTVYESNGVRIGMAYQRAGDTLLLEPAPGYIINIGVGAVDGGLHGIELQAPPIVGMTS